MRIFSSEVNPRGGRCSRLRWSAALLLVVALLVPCAVSAQVLYGSLTGSITDPSAATVLGAKVEATNTETGVVKQVVSNERGDYLFRDLQPGRYNVAVSSPAFSTAKREGVVITANQQVRLDVTLQVAQVSESVQVSAAALALQTDRADVNVAITSKQVTELPITGGYGRNVQSLLGIVAGALSAGEQNSAAGNPQRAISFNVNGVSRLQNNTKLDGSSIVYPWLPTNIAYVPPSEAVETVNIVTNSFNAEQGMAGGAAVNMIVKSGTNDFHGSAWLYNTNAHFKARNYFQTTPQNPKDIINQFGLTFGGPVMLPKLFNGKNKLFFFFDWERSTRRQTASVKTVNIAPSNLRGGDFSAASSTIYDPLSNSDPTKRTAFAGNIIPTSRIDGAAVIMAGLLPAPTSSGYTSNYASGGVGSYTRDNIDIKVNEHIRDRLSYFARYGISPSLITDPPLLGAAGGDALNGGQLGTASGRIQVAGAGATYTISPTLIFDINLGFTRQRLGADGVYMDKNYGLDVLKIPGTNGPSAMERGYPSFQVSNWANMGNPNTGNPFLFRDNQYVGSTSLGWAKAAHAFRYGFEFQNQKINHFQPQGGTFQTCRGTFTFNGYSSALQNSGVLPTNFNSWADFLLGYAATAGKVTQFVNPNSIYMKSYALYAQDQYQVTRKLTLNYGMRWELYPFPRRDHGGVSRFDPSDGYVYVGGHGSVPVDTYASSGHGTFEPRIGIAYRLNEKTVIRTGYGLSADPKPFIDFRNAYPIVNAWAMPTPSNSYLSATTLRAGLDEATYGASPDLSTGKIKLPASSGTTTYPKDAMRKYIQSWNFMVQRELPKSFMLQTGYVATRAVGQQQYLNINAGAPGTANPGRALYPSLGLTGDINEIMPFKTTTYDSLQSQLTKRWGGSMFGVVHTWSHNINWADNDSNPRVQYPAAWNLNRGTASYDRAQNLQAYFVVESPFGKGHKFVTSGIGAMLLRGWELNGILGAMGGQPLWIIQSSGGNLNAAGSSQISDQIKPQVTYPRGHDKYSYWFDTSAFQSVSIPSGQTQRFGNAGRNTLRGPKLVNMDMGLFRTFAVKERVKIQFRAEAMNWMNHTNFNNPTADVSSSTFGTITSTMSGERQFRFATKISF
jgi:hypothetical protein